MNEFEKLNIIEPVLKVISEEGFTEPTEIQKKTIPLIQEGKDVIAGSATGSGKTLAFACGVIEYVEKKSVVQSLILVPTRELAEQVSDAIKKFSKHKKLKVVSVYGGVSINPQIENLRRADVVVGTPGRIMDHMERETIDFSETHFVVLDEADTMLDMGFIDDVRRIVSVCPKQRQTLLFSATITPEIRRVSKWFLKDPVDVAVKNQVDPTKLKQVYYDVRPNQKLSLLISLIKNEKPGLVMVFCNSRDNVDFVTKNLNAQNIRAKAIHGGFSQDRRSKVLQDFHKSEVSVMVCTDVAARGLDIPSVSHVYNFDVPKDPKQYVHRIGRTARAGKEGIAITILSQNDHQNFGRLNQSFTLDIKKQEIPKELPNVQIVQSRGDSNNSGDRRGNYRSGGNGGKRGGSGGGRPPSRYGGRSSGGSAGGRSSGRSSGNSNRLNDDSNSSKRSNYSRGNQEGSGDRRGGSGNRSSGGSSGGRSGGSSGNRSSGGFAGGRSSGNRSSGGAPRGN
ncbi:DEAD/DEAH box helicase, partial [Candidatus Woesearchaeota archaeon]|nr:DEAD/DEAH box helicase [Candidatus Woesearchaeota archaeon]